MKKDPALKVTPTAEQTPISPTSKPSNSPPDKKPQVPQTSAQYTTSFEDIDDDLSPNAAFHRKYNRAKTLEEKDAVVEDYKRKWISTETVAINTKPVHTPSADMLAAMLKFRPDDYM